MTGIFRISAKFFGFNQRLITLTSARFKFQLHYLNHFLQINNNFFILSPNDNCYQFQCNRFFIIVYKQWSILWSANISTIKEFTAKTNEWFTNGLNDFQLTVSQFKMFYYLQKLEKQTTFDHNLKNQTFGVQL